MLLVLTLFYAAQSYGAWPLAPPAPVERLEGLSHNTIVSLLEDREGYLWIGTADGLNRYDGYGFVVYRHVPGDRSSLPNNMVKALAEGGSGQLWIGTDGGLSRLDRRTGTFTRVSLGLDDRPYDQRAVLALSVDASGDVWAATNAAGLYRIDGSTGSVRSYRLGESGLGTADHAIWSVFEDRRGVLWISSDDAVYHYVPETDRLERNLGLDVFGAAGIVWEDDRGLWVSGPSGLVLLDPTTNHTYAPPESAELPPPLTTVQGRDGTRWVGTASGLFRIEPGSGRPEKVPLAASPDAYLENHVRVLLRDRADAVWIGTLGGLFRADPNAKPFRHVARDPSSTNSLSSNTVMAIVEDQGDIFWLGTLGGGLNRVHRTSGDVTRFRHDPDQPESLCGDLVWSLARDGEGRIWVGTNTGLCILQTDTGRFARLPLRSAHDHHPSVSSILKGRSGRLWIGTYYGLFEVDPREWSARLMLAPPNPPNPAFASVQAIHEDRNGTIWVSFFGAALYRIVPDAPGPERVPLVDEAGVEIVGEGIWAIHGDHEGSLWLGGDQGLMYVRPDSAIVRQYSVADGLPGSTVYALGEDEDGHLWTSTNRGLARVEVRDGSVVGIRVFGEGDGLQNVEFNRRAVYRSPQDELFFGGLNGLTTFFPREIADNPYVPPVVLTRIQIASRDRIQVIEPYEREGVVLSHRDYGITLEFAALNFSNPTRNQYAYRMHGFDESWIQSGSRNFAHYTNLPPGNYRFQAIGSNNDFVWNEVGVSIAVWVQPKYWQTWWFPVLIVALITGMLTGLYRYRVNWLLQVERMRLRIAGDLHDDVGSNLSSIALLSDMVRDRSRLGARDLLQLEKISYSARSMVDALRDIVWTIDPKTDKPELVVKRMEESAGLLLGEIRWTFEAPGLDAVAALDMEARRDLFLMYKEVLHNISRHASATRVRITVERLGRVLSVSVEDDGLGFEMAAVRTGHGLVSLQQRAVRNGGDLRIDSVPGAGTRVEIRLPVHRGFWGRLRFAAGRKPAGT